VCGGEGGGVRVAWQVIGEAVQALLDARAKVRCIGCWSMIESVERAACEGQCMVRGRAGQVGHAGAAQALLDGGAKMRHGWSTGYQSTRGIL
jgi:hypothetical protein